MPARRKRPVSLAATAKAGGLRRGFTDATPERLRQAGGAGGTQIGPDGVRRMADPFDTLRSRGLLAPADPRLNDLLWQAGERFRQHWARAADDGLATIDLSRPAVDGGPGGRDAPGPPGLRHAEALRAARAAVGPRLEPYLVGLVIDARPAAALAAEVTETGHARTAAALVLERLREALHRLCEHWRLIPRVRPTGIRAWHAEP